MTISSSGIFASIATVNLAPLTTISGVVTGDASLHIGKTGWTTRGLSINTLFGFLANQTDVVNAKLTALQNSGSSMSITDMFEMQMKMNRLSQFSEMTTAVVSASSGSI